MIRLVMLLATLTPPALALPCSEYVTKEKVPWIFPAVLNAPAVQRGEVIGKVAIWRDQVVAARPCKWCPRFASQEEANEWIERDPLGPSTGMAAASLLRLSRRGFADAFYGFTLAAGELHFVTKIPSGAPLRHLVESHGPWIIDSFRRPLDQQVRIGSLGPIPSDAVKSAVKIRNALNEPDALFPFPFLTYGPPAAGGISLLDFLNAVEWSVESGGAMKVSFYNLDKIYQRDGSLRKPLFKDNSGQIGTSYSHIFLSTLTLMSNNVGQAYTNLLNAKVAQFFWLPGMVEALRSEGVSGDTLLRKVREYTTRVHLPPVGNLMHIYERGEMRYTPHADFASPDLLASHFAKHGANFHANSAEGYLEMARRFLSGADVAAECGIESTNRRVLYIRGGRDVDEYIILDPDSRITAVVTVNGVLKTFFIQSNTTSGMDPEQYLVEQARRNLDLHIQMRYD